ncbi:MAG TPA: mechanosensitive ion channel domain-containing protein [Myxococcota bacterium]|nr:mechanosensitive ion channel domain-containing protein [Myxococcota bacterium]
MSGSDLLAVAPALPIALAAHALLRRLEHRLPLWLARRRADEPGARAAAAARARGVIGPAMLAPKAALWLALAAWAAERVMPLGAARDALARRVDTSLMAPLLDAQGRSFTALELLELPALLVAVWLAVGLIARALRWQLARAGGMELGAGDTIATWVRYALGGLAALVVLQAWGFDVRSFALLGGVIGVGLGFGLQHVTSNFVSGLLLAFERPIRPGDFVRVGESTGTVLRIGARATEIRTPDHVSILVPNARFLEGEVVNWSHRSPRCRLHVPVGLAYGTDPARARTALLEAACGHPKVLADPRPGVDLDGFGDSALLFDLEVWTDDPAAQEDTISDLRYRIAASLRRHGLEVPFPQRDLHLRAPELLRLADAYGRREFPDWLAGGTAPAPGVEPDAALPPPPDRPAAWSDEQLLALAGRLRGPGGVALADRRHLLRVHRRCFVGSEAVQWLVAHESLTRAEAVAAGRRLVERGWVRHVLDEHGFEDARLFYRFTADEAADDAGDAAADAAFG